MALVKKPVGSSTSAASETSANRVSSSSARDAEVQRKRARTLAKQQQAAERIAAATGQMSSGIAEAASAAEELKRAADQFSTGAEEASGACQQCLTSIRRAAAGIETQQKNVAITRDRAEATQILVANTSAEVANLVNNVGLSARRQTASMEMVGELEKQAANIGDIVKAVARIADQTNLLALNAAIEAARAGQHGKGFAVVADEVRTLAETSEKSAKQIQDLVGQIQQEVKVIAEGISESLPKASVNRPRPWVPRLRMARSSRASLTKSGVMQRTSSEASMKSQLAQNSLPKVRCSRSKAGRKLLLQPRNNPQQLKKPAKRSQSKLRPWAPANKPHNISLNWQKTSRPPPMW